MKIGLMAYNLTVHSGQTRFLVNIAMGLKKKGYDVCIYSLGIDEKIKNIFDNNKICYYAGNFSANIFSKLRMITYNLKLAKKLANIIKANDFMDYYVALQDEAIPVIKFIKNNDKKYVYISNGDLSLLFFNQQYMLEYGFLWKYLSYTMVKRVWNNSKLASMYDMVLGNSNFTSNIMSFIYNIPVSGYVYPPVDDAFKPTKYREEKEYCLAILRNVMEPGYPYIKKLSDKIKIKVVGNASIEGADNLGFVSEKELIDLYSGAKVTLSINPQEFYGYTTVESLKCGTPVIAFNNGGAQEIIQNNFNGWLFNRKTELMSTAYSIMNHGYDPQVRANALASSKNYSVETSADKLLYYLNSL